MADLGPDEQAVHDGLLELEAEVEGACSQIAAGAASREADKHLQELLLRIRGAIRDLELLADEQDT
jgi:hypothetical protein